MTTRPRIASGINYTASSLRSSSKPCSAVTASTSTIQYDHCERPTVMAWVEPGDYTYLGDGFYVEAWPDPGGDDFIGEPIAPYQRSSLPSPTLPTPCVTQSSDGACHGSI
ncbi:MAG: hypothetical protein WKF60_00120 [Ilumatobacter sp.]